MVAGDARGLAFRRALLAAAPRNSFSLLAASFSRSRSSRILILSALRSGWNLYPGYFSRCCGVWSATRPLETQRQPGAAGDDDAIVDEDCQVQTIEYCTHLLLLLLRHVLIFRTNGLCFPFPQRADHLADIGLR